MARTTSQLKMGYYPTPVSEMELIKAKIQINKTENETVSVLDMCCGTGEFKTIFPDLDLYGVELDYERYKIASEKLHVVWGDALSELTCTNNVFSCLYLNPPYDWSASEKVSERMESIFLRKTLRYLKKYGLLVFVIPRKVLSKCSRVLANNFKQIQVLAFSPDEYDAFKQIVVFGYRENGIDKETEDYLNHVSDSEELIISRLGEDDSQFILNPGTHPKTFLTKRLDPESVRNKLLKTRFKLSDLYRKEPIGTINTIMPLRQGHKAMLLASGQMNGVYGTGESRILIKTTSKEQLLIDIISENKTRGRKVLVYAEYTGSKDITGDLDELLTIQGISTLILKSTVQAERRQQWIEQQLKANHYDCMICNPRLVQTGLDLLDFPTIVYFQTGTSVYVLRQASRRSWRIGQTQPVNIHFLCYKETMQARLLTLMAKKMETSLSIEGDLDENGLSALSDSGDNLILEMARSIMNNTSFGSLDTAWKSYRKTEQKITGIPVIPIKKEEERTDNVIQFVRPKTVERLKPQKMVQLTLFAI
jgi:SAM-dependent methyltransferase